jgi:hypothetical protein
MRPTISRASAVCRLYVTVAAGALLLAAAATARAAQPQVHDMSRGATIASAPAGAHLTYFGGRVISNVQVVQVLYGGSQSDYASGVWNTSTPSLASFYSGVTQSPYFDWLVEYDTPSAGGTDQVIGLGTFLGQVHITPSAANDQATISDAQIQSEIGAQLTAGSLPPPTKDPAGNPNTVYMINFPRGKTIALGSNLSCQNFCAYHTTFSLGVQSVYYAVLPDMEAPSGCASGCGANPVAFNNQTAVASHELVEQVTDPVATRAWYDTTNGEIADICNAQQGAVIGRDGVTYVVEKLFSNAASDCIVTRAIATPVPAVGGRALFCLAAALLVAGVAPRGETGGGSRARLRRRERWARAASVLTSGMRFGRVRAHFSTAARFLLCAGSIACGLVASPIGASGDAGGAAETSDTTNVVDAARGAPIDASGAPSELVFTCEGTPARVAVQLPCKVGYGLSGHDIPGQPAAGSNVTECELSGYPGRVVFSLTIPLGALPGLLNRPLQIPGDFGPPEPAVVPGLELLEGTLVFSQVDPIARAFVGRLHDVKAAWGADPMVACSLQDATIWAVPGRFL